MRLTKPKTTRDKKLLAQIKKLPCSVCGRVGQSDPSHIRSKGAGGPDTAWNVVPMCRECHRYWHDVGWKTFLDNRPTFARKLIALGWVIDPELMGLWHPELREDSDD